MLNNWNTPVSELKGVGPKTAEYFNNLGISNIYELLNHFPRTYLVFGGLKKISELQHDEIAAVRVRVDMVGNLRRVKNKMTILPIEVSDETGSMVIKYFNMPFMAKAVSNSTAAIRNGFRFGIILIEVKVWCKGTKKSQFSIPNSQLFCIFAP